MLNDFIALERPVHQAIRQRINSLLANEAKSLDTVHDQVFIQGSRTKMHLPARIGDYTDIYAGIHHAENVGRMLRPNCNGGPGDPLLRTIDICR